MNSTTRANRIWPAVLINPIDGGVFLVILADGEVFLEFHNQNQSDLARGGVLADGGVLLETHNQTQSDLTDGGVFLVILASGGVFIKACSQNQSILATAEFFL